LSAIWIGPANASGAGYGVLPAVGAEKKTWLFPCPSGSSGLVGAPFVRVSITIPRPPLFMTVGYAPMPWPANTSPGIFWRFGSQFESLSQSRSQ